MYLEVEDCIGLDEQDLEHQDQEDLVHQEDLLIQQVSPQVEQFSISQSSSLTKRNRSELKTFELWISRSLLEDA